MRNWDTDDQRNSSSLHINLTQQNSGPGKITEPLLFFIYFSSVLLLLRLIIKYAGICIAEIFFNKRGKYIFLAVIG